MHRITITPGDRSFTAFPVDTLLEAGLRAGIALPYGCSNGNCGDCVARVLSGQVERVHHHDFAFAERERLGGHILLCSNAARGDVVLEARIAGDAREIPAQRLTARVVDVDRLSEDVCGLRLRTPRRQRLRFLAGQHLRVVFDGRADAALAIASCPCDDRNVELHVDRRTHPELWAEAPVLKARSVQLHGPFGRFTLNEEAHHHLLFVALDAGFASVKSLVEQAMALERGERLYIVWLTSGEGQPYLDNLARSWEDAFDNVTYLPLRLGCAPDACARAIGNALDAVSDWDDWEAYVAAGEPVRSAILGALSARSLAPSRVRVEHLR